VLFEMGAWEDTQNLVLAYGSQKLLLELGGSVATPPTDSVGNADTEAQAQISPTQLPPLTSQGTTTTLSSFFTALGTSQVVEKHETNEVTKQHHQDTRNDTSTEPTVHTRALEPEKKPSSGGGFFSHLLSVILSPSEDE